VLARGTGEFSAMTGSLRASSTATETRLTTFVAQSVEAGT
jgi:hypothetical protein